MGQFVQTGGDSVVPLNFNANGDNIVQAAVTGKKIRVLSLSMRGAGAVTVTPSSDVGGGATRIGADYVLAAGTGPDLPLNEAGWMDTAAGKALNFKTGAGVVVTGSMRVQFID